MLVKMLKSKLHALKITSVNASYNGSIGIDKDLMEFAGIFEHEFIYLWSRSGDIPPRIETYAFSLPAGSGRVEVFGGAAKILSVGDEVIASCFCDIPIELAPDHKPTIVLVDKDNKIYVKEKYVDGYCENCSDRSSHIKEDLCPTCYTKIVTGE